MIRYAESTFTHTAEREEKSTKYIHIHPLKLLQKVVTHLNKFQSRKCISDTVNIYAWSVWWTCFPVILLYIYINMNLQYAYYYTQTNFLHFVTICIVLFHEIQLYRFSIYTQYLYLFVCYMRNALCFYNLRVYYYCTTPVLCNLSNYSATLRVTNVA